MPAKERQPTRAASYCRVSTTLQADEGLSLDVQEERVAAHIESEGWQLAGVYREAGVSGRRTSRPELDRLLGDLDALDVVVIPRLDRLGRSNRHLLELFDRFEEAGVRLVSMNENIDVTSQSGRMLRSLLSMMAEAEADNISERVRSVQGARVAKGKHHGRPPYGYEPRDGNLVPVRHEAAIVRRIFDAFLAGTSQRQITRKMIADGVPAPRTNWHQGTVSQILRNVTYAGRIRFNGEVHPGQHEAIIEPTKWDQAAKLLDASARTKGWRGKQPPMHLFVKGHLKCARCGESMVPRSGRSDGPDTYRCYSRLRLGPDACDQKPVKREVVDGAVLRYFERAALDVAATREQLSGALDRQLTEVRSLRDRAAREAQRATDRLARVKRDYQDGQLDASDWRDQRKELTAERDAAEAEARRLEEHESSVAEGAALNDVEATTLQRLTDLRAAVVGEVRDAEDVAAVRAVLVKMFDHFRLHAAGAVDIDALADDDPYIDALAAGDYLIVTEPRRETVAGLDEEWHPILHREPILMTGNSDGEALTR